MNFDYTPKASGPKKAIGLSVTQTINNDGTASTNAIFQDSDGLPITAAQFNNLYPVGVALPTVTAGDSTPGPSAFKVVAVTPPTASTAVPGAFVVATTSAVTPPSVPPPTGWGQAVDFTCSIASGLVGQSTTQSVDAGTLSVVSNSNNPAAFTVSTNSSGVGPRNETSQYGTSQYGTSQYGETVGNRASIIGRGDGRITRLGEFVGDGTTQYDDRDTFGNKFDPSSVSAPLPIDPASGSTGDFATGTTLTQAQLDALTAAKVPAASNTSPLTQAQLAALVAAGVPATTIKSAFTSPAKPTITPGYQHSPDPSTGRKIY
jgi:hypothetical protein